MIQKRKGIVHKNIPEFMAKDELFGQKHTVEFIYNKREKAST